MASRGTVLLSGKAVNGVPAYKRSVHMVFQYYALFPHKDVASNAGFGLRQARPRHASLILMKLRDKTALITGGNKGIGLAITQRYAGEGATCVILARNHEAGLDVVSDMERKGG